MVLPVPLPYSANTGNFLTAGIWNASVRDGIGFLTNPPSFRGYATVAQTLTDNTWTSLNIDTEVFDNYGGHSTTTNTSRYTCQLAGLYMVTGVAAFSSNATGNRAVRIAVNGTAVNGTFVKAPAAAVTASSAQTTTALVQLALGDYVEVMGNQNSGAGLATSVSGPDVNPSLQVLWVSQ